MSTLLEMFRDTAIKAHMGYRHEGPWETCEWVECEDRRKMIDSATTEQATPADTEQLVRLREAAKDALTWMDWWKDAPATAYPLGLPSMTEMITALRNALGAQEGEQSNERNKRT